MPRLLTSLLATTLMVAPAIAQETFTADTVIVTAPGPERPSGELIGAATSIDREDILETLSASLGDTLDRQPGVSTTFFGAGASRPVLRGLGAERVQVLTNGIGVIDVSTASPDHQVAADGIDAQTIEVLRGPAALAYGGAAVGGVVNVIDGLIVSELPEDAMSGDLFGAYNTVNEGTELAGRGQFVTGPFVFTLSASQRDFDNYDIPDFAESSLLRALEEAEHGDDDDDDHEEEEETRDTLENSFVETQTLAAGLSWVGENAFLGVAVRQQTAEYGLPGHSHEHEHEEEGGDEEEEEEENPFIDLEQTRVDLRGGIELHGDFLKAITATFAYADYEHTEFEAPGEAGTFYANEGTEGRIAIDHAFNGFQGTFGAQYVDREFVADGEEAFIAPTDSDSFGFFIYETQEWDTGIGIEGGLRLDYVGYENRDWGSQDFSLFSGSLGVHQHLSNGFWLGGQVSYTERAPIETELFAFGNHIATDQFEVGNPNQKEETAINFEGTLRWSGESGGIGVNVFTTEFKDFIYLRSSELTPEEAMMADAMMIEVEFPVFRFVQENATFSGGEIYADYALDGPLGAEWEFGASVDFVDAELDSGDNVPLIPPLTFNADASAEWGAWEVGAALTIAADQDNPGPDELETEGYTTLDLRGEVDLSDFGFGADGTEAFIEARNVTDEEIRFSTSVLKDLAPAPGQNFRAGIRVAF